MKKQLITAILCMILTVCFAMTATAGKPDASDMENLAGHPGMTAEQTADGMHIVMDAADGAGWATRWGYACPHTLDGLTVKIKNLKMDTVLESGICVALGNYSGAYDCDQSLMFILNSNRDDGAWVYGRTGTPDTPLFDMAGCHEAGGFAAGSDVTLEWKRKSTDVWAFCVNGEEFTFADEKVRTMLEDDEFIFLTFGGWGYSTTVDYTVTDISSHLELPTSTEKTTASTAAPTASTTAKATDGTTAPTVPADPTEPSAPVETEMPTDTAEPVDTEEPSETEEPTETAEPTETTEPATEPADEKGGLPLWAIVVGIAVIVIAAAATVAIVLKRKKQ